MFSCIILAQGQSASRTLNSRAVAYDTHVCHHRDIGIADCLQVVELFIRQSANIIICLDLC